MNKLCFYVVEFKSSYRPVVARVVYYGFSKHLKKRFLKKKNYLIAGTVFPFYFKAKAVDKFLRNLIKLDKILRKVNIHLNYVFMSVFYVIFWMYLGWQKLYTPIFDVVTNRLNTYNVVFKLHDFIIHNIYLETMIIHTQIFTICYLIFLSYSMYLINKKLDQSIQNQNIGQIKNLIECHNFMNYSNWLFLNAFSITIMANMSDSFVKTIFLLWSYIYGTLHAEAILRVSTFFMGSILAIVFFASQAILEVRFKNIMYN